MLKPFLIVVGTLFLVLGTIGIIVPGLPTTPFLLLTAIFYVKSSDRLYAWLLGHKLFGKIVRDYREKRAISVRSKSISLCLMWTMILLSVFVFIDPLAVKVVVLALGAIGTFVLLRIPTYTRIKKEGNE